MAYIQSNNLVMLCKFKSLLNSFEIDSLYSRQTQKICIRMTKCQVGFATNIVLMITIVLHQKHPT